MTVQIEGLTWCDKTDNHNNAVANCKDCPQHGDCFWISDVICCIKLWCINILDHFCSHLLNCRKSMIIKSKSRRPINHTTDQRKILDTPHKHLTNIHEGFFSVLVLFTNISQFVFSRSTRFRWNVQKNPSKCFFTKLHNCLIYKQKLKLRPSKL